MITQGILYCRTKIYCSTLSTSLNLFAGTSWKEVATFSYQSAWYDIVMKENSKNWPLL